MDNDTEVRNDLLWKTFSILKFRHCFKLYHFLFLLFIRVIRKFYHPSLLLSAPILRQPNPPHSNKFSRTFSTVCVLLLFIYFFVLFLHYIAQYSRLLGAISCICLHLKNFYLNLRFPLSIDIRVFLHSRNVISNLIDFCIFFYFKSLCFCESLWWLLLKTVICRPV